MVTYVLDASALVAYFLDRPGAVKVEELLKTASRRRSNIFMSAVNLGEAYGFILRTEGVEQARAMASTLPPLPIIFIEATVQRCCHAAEIKNAYKLYYADAFAAALALENKATLVTSDSDFRRLGHNFPILWLKPTS